MHKRLFKQGAAIMVVALMFALAFAPTGLVYAQQSPTIEGLRAQIEALHAQLIALLQARIAELQRQIAALRGERPLPPARLPIVTPTGATQDIIRADVTAQNNRDWSAFLAIRTAQSGPPESRVDWEAIRRIDPGADIMQNIIGAQLVGIRPIPLELAQTITRMDGYIELYPEVRTYYVAINYQVRREDRGLRNGVNFRLYVLGLERGNWVIVEASQMPVHRMVEAGHGFGTPEERRELERGR